MGEVGPCAGCVEARAPIAGSENRKKVPRQPVAFVGQPSSSWTIKAGDRAAGWLEINYILISKIKKYNFKSRCFRKVETFCMRSKYRCTLYDMLAD